MINRLSANKTVFFICDMQEVFRKGIFEMESVINATKSMLLVARELNIPCIVTEQYPKGLGHTMTDFDELIKGTGDQKPYPVFDKTKFSMVIPEIEKYLKENYPDIDTVVLLGAETHICITQTCYDLLKLNYQPYIVVDGVSSMTDFDRKVALSRLQKCNVILSSVEQLIFELAEDSKNPHFKTLSAIVKDYKKTERKLTF